MSDTITDALERIEPFTELLGSLRKRGLLDDAAEEDGIIAGFTRGEGAYLGIDPTAPSMHVGHLLPIMMARRLAASGIPVVMLVGGATAQVGDPSGRQTMRPMSDTAQTALNASRVGLQAARLVPGSMLVNNLDWTSGIGLLPFLRDIGSRVSMNTLLSMDSLRSRMTGENGEAGLTFLEAAYPLMQAWDFCHLAMNHGIVAQIGGRDQWGNVTMGMDIWNRTRDSHGRKHRLGGLFTPLLVNAAGEKMGKSAGGAVWLDPAMTSPFDFHQFWLRMDDASVRRNLPMLLECDDTELERLLFLQGQDFNEAKKALADSLTLMVHGDIGLANAERIRAAVLEGGSDETAPRVIMNSDRRLIEALRLLGFASSLSEARRHIRGKGVILNDFQADDEHALLAEGEHHIRFGKTRIGVALVNP